MQLVPWPLQKTARRALATASALLTLCLLGCDQSATEHAQPLVLRGEPIIPHAVDPATAEPVAPGASSNATEQAAVAETIPPAEPPAEQDAASLAALDSETVTEDTPPPPALISSLPAVIAEPDGKGFVPLGFDVLSGYAINIPDEMLSSPLASLTNAMHPSDLIPENVKKLNERQVSLEGFMLPLKVEGGLVTELLLMKDQSMCCYGTVPRINEWVSVRMNERGVKPIMDVPVTLHGTLHVGAILENGYLVGIYSMDGEKMTGLLDE